jgi:Arc/MetJ-type ribon-helix-helix transcriptional regulator
MQKQYKSKDLRLVNFKLKRSVVEVLDQLVETGLYKSRVDVILASLRDYEPFKTKWKESEDLLHKSQTKAKH